MRARRFWLTTNPSPNPVVHPPFWHRDIVAAVYEHNALERELVPLVAVPVLEGPTHLTITEHDDHNEATVAVDRVGEDVVDVLARALDAEAEAGCDLVHVDLSLHDPGTAGLPPAVHEDLGVFFGVVVPELRRGDVLRLQWLNRVDADPSDVVVASDFGAELLAYVFNRDRTDPSA